MAFDPDSYLAKKKGVVQKGGGFDPDAYLKKKELAPSVPGVIGRGAAQGLSFGFADEISAGVQAPFSEKTYQEIRDENRAQLEADKAAYPKTAIASEIGGAVIPSVAAEVLSGGSATPAVGANALRMGQVAKTLFNPTTVKGLAASGAAFGLGSSEADLTKGEVGQAAMDTAKGGALGYGFGKAVPVVGKYAGEVLEGAGKKLGEGAEFLASKAVGLTKGLRKRFDLTPAESRGVGREALESGIVSPLSDAEEMARAATIAKKDIGEKIHEMLVAAEESGGKPNIQNIINTLKEKQAEYAGNRIGKPIFNQYAKVIADLEGMRGNAMLDLPESLANFLGETNVPIGGTPTGVGASIQDLQGYKEILGETAYPKGVAQESKVGYQGAYTPIKEEIESAVERGHSPQQKQLYKYLKNKYQNQKYIGEGLTDKLAAEEGNRFIRPTDFLVGGAFGLGGGVLPGIASVVAKRGIEKYGHQVGAITMDKVSKMLTKTPQVFGPYSQIIQQAIQRGGQAFATTNFLLQQKDPEYRKIMEDVSNREEEEADGTQPAAPY